MGTFSYLIKPLKSNFATSRKISKALDIWAFGLIVSELLGGEIPWGDDYKKNPNLILMALLNKKKFPIPKSIIDPEIIYLIESCTEYHPKDRIEIKEIINLVTCFFKNKLESISNDINIETLFSKRKGYNFVNRIRALVPEFSRYRNNIYFNKQMKENEILLQSCIDKKFISSNSFKPASLILFDDRLSEVKAFRLLQCPKLFFDSFNSNVNKLFLRLSIRIKLSSITFE